MSTANKTRNGIQILARHPLTKNIVRVTNSKVVRTVGSESVGTGHHAPVMICADFLEDACRLGQRCPELHVLGMSRKGWSLIPVADDDVCLDGHTHHEPGWTIAAYDNTMTYLVEVPSEDVVQTRGSVKYAKQFNAQGPNGRYRYQICGRFRAGRCREGMACGMIHTKVNLRKVEKSGIHVNETVEDASCARYTCLPAGATFRVRDPNLESKYTEVPSEHVLCTQGSEAYFENPSGYTRRLLHCAHYYLKRLCNRGPECTFIHVLSVRGPSRAVTTTPSPSALNQSTTSTEFVACDSVQCSALSNGSGCLTEEESTGDIHDAHTSNATTPRMTSLSKKSGEENKATQPQRFSPKNVVNAPMFLFAPLAIDAVEDITTEAEEDASWHTDINVSVAAPAARIPHPLVAPSSSRYRHDPYSMEAAVKWVA